MNELNKPSAFFTKGQNGEYEYEHEGFVHIHSPVHEQISEGLTLHNSLPCPPIGRFSLTLRGHNSGPFARYVLKFRLYPAYVMPSLRSLPQFGL